MNSQANLDLVRNPRFPSFNQAPNAMNLLANVKGKHLSRIFSGFKLIDVLYVIAYLAILLWFSLNLLKLQKPTFQPLNSKQWVETLTVFCGIAGVMGTPLTWLHLSLRLGNGTLFAPVLTIAFINFCAFAVGDLVALLSLCSTLITFLMILANKRKHRLHHRTVLILQSLALLLVGLLGPQILSLVQR